MASVSIPGECQRNGRFRWKLAKWPIGLVFQALLILVTILILSSSLLLRGPTPGAAASWQQQHFDYLPFEKTTAGTSEKADLSRLTGSARRYSCDAGLVYVEDVTHAKNRQHGRRSETDDRLQAIPRIIHQTSKSRCVTPDFYRAIQQWRSWAPGYEHYFHDDAAVLRLLRQEAANFPNLDEVVRFCVQHGTMRADLWRYLVLYVYGGIYVDIDAVPKNLVPPMFHNATGVFLVEQYHLLSQYFMAMTPGHPLMWYAIQVSLLQLSSVSDTGSAPTAMITGPHALHKAFIEFSRDAGEVIESAGIGRKPIKAGMYTGTWNLTVRAYGNASNQNEYVNRDTFSAHQKKHDYRRMGMRHFSEDKLHPTGTSCLSAILQESTRFIKA